MRVTTPNDGEDKYKLRRQHKTVMFLAGGISGCKDWQSETINAIKELESLFNLSSVLFVNPRHPAFDVDDPNAMVKQVQWEHYWLEHSDAVTFFFDNSESLHPITLYELGKWGNKKPNVITVTYGYKREKDVFVQTSLDGLYCHMCHPDDAVKHHAYAIAYLADNLWR